MAKRTALDLTGPMAEAVAHSVRDLIGLDVLNGRYRVCVPLLMPSGSLLDVSIFPEPGGTFMVSDSGAAWDEADNFGISHRAFARIAGAKAAETGAIFDGLALLMLRTSPDHLRMAIIEVANLARDVAIEAAESALRSRSASEHDLFAEAVKAAFPNAPVAFEVEFSGQSTATHRFDAMVDLGGRRALFDLFSKDPASVASTYLKLSDVYRADDAPGLVGVTRDPQAVGPKLELIASVARVVSLDAGPPVFVRAAA